MMHQYTPVNTKEEDTRKPIYIYAKEMNDE